MILRITALLTLTASSLFAADDTLEWKPLPDLPGGLGVAGPFAGTHNDALIIAGGTLIYAGLLHYKVLPFGLVTFAFLFLTIWTLENLSLKRALPAAIVAAVMSFGTEYLFTKVFIVDLPT